MLAIIAQKQMNKRTSAFIASQRSTRTLVNDSHSFLICVSFLYTWRQRYKLQSISSNPLCWRANSKSFLSTKYFKGALRYICNLVQQHFTVQRYINGEYAYKQISQRTWDWHLSLFFFFSFFLGQDLLCTVKFIQIYISYFWFFLSSRHLLWGLFVLGLFA